MGIFDKFKQMISKDIAPDVSKLTGLVCPYVTKGSRIKIDTNLKVPKGFAFVIGYKGRALDCFLEGDYVLAPATLPECCRKLKIHKQNSDGSFKKAFDANAYFVRFGEFELDYKTLEKAELGSRSLGIFNVGLTATIKYEVKDAKLFMQGLLDEFDYIKHGEDEKILKEWLSEVTVRTLFKYNFALSEFLTSNTIITDNLFRELSHKLQKYGINLIELKNVRYILPKSHQAEYEKNLEAKNAAENNIQEVEDNNNRILISQPNEQETLIVENEEPQNEYIDFENVDNAIEIQSQSEVIEQTNTEVLTMQVQNVEEENTVSDSAFVDLNLDNLYKDDAGENKCEYCGYINNKDYKICEVCGTKLNNKGE